MGHAPERTAAPDPAAVQRRTMRVLVLAQVLGGAGLTAGITVGGLLGEEMIGGRGWSGLPAALFTLGSALAAWLVGVVSQRAGRRAGLTLGYAAGAAGGAGTFLAAAVGSVPLLVVSLFVYGAGSATSLLARYAGADLSGEDRRGRAISVVLLATTLGAVLGPNLTDVAGGVAADAGVRALAGPFALAALAYAAAAVAVLALLRPDPLLTARALARAAPDRDVLPAGPAGPAERRAVLIAAAAMVTSQLVMLGVMTMTPVHMRDHGQGLGATGVVISLHIAAMFLPSPVSGLLADRIGRRAVVALGGMALGAAGVVAAIAPAGSATGLAVALILLGLGWNLGVIGGTAILTDAVPVERRARTQGTVDVSLSLAGAAGGMGSGVVAAASGFAALALLGGTLGLLLLPLLLAAGTRAARPVPEAA